MAERQQRYEASLRGMPIFRHLGQVGALGVLCVRFWFRRFG